MKKIFLSLLTVLFSGVALAQDATLVFPESVTIQPGKTAEFAVAMNNTVNINSLSCEFFFPEGISIQSYFDEEECDDVYSVEKTDRGRSSATLSIMPTTRGGIQVAVYHSNTKQYFKENSGDVLNITIAADANLSAGTYPVTVSNINFGDMQGQSILQDDVTFNVVVAKECSVNVAGSEHGTVSLSPEADSYLSGTEVTATATPFEGYKFVKWTNGVEDLSTENPYTFVVEDDVTLTPVFEAINYTVTFCDEDGTVISEQSLPYGSNITAPENPTKEGYTFVGWNPEVDATVPAHDVSYTATYKVNQYTVFYKYEDKTIHEESVNYGDAIPDYTWAPENDEEFTYTFNGWISEDGEVYTTMPAHDIVFIADVLKVSGIDTIMSSTKAFDVYSVDGVKVKSAVKASELNTLTTGVYIVDGVKIVIK